MTIPPSQSKAPDPDYSSYTAVLLALAANASKDQQKLISRHWLTRLKFDLEDWIFAAVSNLFGWLSKASLFGDTQASIELAQLQGRSERNATVGIVPPPRTQERLEQSYRTIGTTPKGSAEMRGPIESAPDIETVKTKVERLARSEVYHEGTRAFLEAAKTGGAQKWVRRVADGRACSLCKLRSGETFEDFAAAVPMHPNCTCSAELVIGDQI